MPPRLEIFGPFFDGGELVDAPRLYHYAVGTTTQKDCWTDYAQNVTATQPVVGDVNGVIAVYLSGLYKLEVRSNDDTRVLAQWDIFNANQLDAESDGTVVDTFTELSAAIALIGSSPGKIIVNDNIFITGSISFHESITVKFLQAGLFTTSMGVSATFVYPSQIEAGSAQHIFSSGSSIVFARGGSVPVTWWGAKGDSITECGASIQSSINSIEGPGGIILIPPGQFNCSTPLTARSRINFSGSGQETSIIHNTNTANGDLLTYFDSTTSNKELRYTYIQDVRFSGNDTSGKGIVVDNAFHFLLYRTKVDSHGGIGIDFQKGISGSTFGQNIFIQECWIELNRKGGVRLSTPGASGHDIAAIRNCSINQNAYYGVYADRQSVLTVDTCEFAGYYYGSVIAAHQAVPLAIREGANIVINNCSFENNGGQTAVRNSSIKTSWNGDTQANASGGPQMLTISNNDFKAVTGTTGDLSHIFLSFCKAVFIEHNSFEKSGGYPDNVYAVEYDTGNLLPDAGIIYNCNNWFALDAQTIGTHTGTVLWNDITPNGVTGSNHYSYGTILDNSTDIGFWNRYISNAYDNFELLGDGTIIRGLGSAAPNVKFLVGAGSPEGVVTAAIGSIYQRTDGGASTSMYVKESGTGNTGWVGK